MKSINLLIGLALLLCASGCTESKFGTYQSAESTISLRSDGTYLYIPEDSDTAQKGTFSIYDNTVELTNVLGMTTILTITKDGLVDDKDKIWRKI